MARDTYHKPEDGSEEVVQAQLEQIARPLQHSQKRSTLSSSHKAQFSPALPRNYSLRGLVEAKNSYIHQDPPFIIKSAAPQAGDSKDVFLVAANGHRPFTPQPAHMVFQTLSKRNRYWTLDVDGETHHKRIPERKAGPGCLQDI